MAPPTNVIKPSTENIGPLAEAVLVVMHELTEVLSEEIKLLETQNIVGIQTLLGRKHKLLMTYQSNMKVIVAHAYLLTQLKEEVRARLKMAGLKLAEIAERSKLVLQAASIATQNLVQHIIGLVRDEAMPVQGYVNTRRVMNSTNKYSPICPPVAVNRTA